MKKKLIAVLIASGSLFGLQASASAQSYAFSGVESQDLSTYYNTPTYWNYAPNALNTAPARIVHQRAHQ